jgi:signal transduction histidine kinase/DNA-binding response OmpR family regulator
MLDQTGTILAVDDSPDSLALVTYILSTAGHQVRQANRGEMALADITAHPPDLVLLDVRMPGLDGLEVCRRLAADASTRRIPVVLVSAITDVVTRVEGLALGAVDYICKPFEAEELLARVSTHLALSRTRAGLEAQAEALARANERLQAETAERRAAEDSLQQQAAHTRAVLHMAERLDPSVESSTLLAGICQETKAALSAHAVSISLAGEDGVLQYAASEGLPAEWSDAVPAVALVDHLRRAATGPDRAFVRSDATQINQPAFVDLCARFDIRSVMAVLVEGRGDVIGAVAVYSVGVPRAFSAQDVRLLRTLANLAAQALSSAGLFARTQAQAARLQVLAARLSDAEEHERTRLAQDLHDQVGQNLTALGINLNLTELDVAAGRFHTLSDRLQVSQGLVRETSRAIQRALLDLRPPALDEYGLLAALRTVCGQWASQTGVRFIVEGQEPAPRLASRVESALYRIAQEALTNVIKYAQATRINVSVVTTPDRIRLAIADDGCGFDVEARRRADDRRPRGLLIMEDRAHAIGAALHVDSAAGAGTNVSVEVQR